MMKCQFVRTLATVLPLAICGTGEALTLTVDADRALTAEEQAALNGDEKNATFTKKGAGTLTVDGIGNFASTMVVEEGVVRVVDRSGLGAERAKVLAVDVKPGARLSLEQGSGKEDRLFGRNIQIAGDGPDGMGALYNNGFDFTKLILAADASITGNVTCIEQRQKGFTSTFDMGGHKLTFKGNDLAWGFTTLLNPGSIRMEAGYLQLKGGCGLAGGATSEFELAGTAWLSFYDWRAPFTWTLHVTSGSAVLHAGSGTDAELSNVISGPVVIDEGVVVPIKNGNDAGWTITFGGKISGAGTLKMLNPGHLRLLASDNDYTGSILVNAANVTVHAPHSGSLARKADGTINFPVLSYTSDRIVAGAQTASHATGWTADGVDALVANYGVSKVILEITEGETFTYDHALTTAFPPCTGGSVAFTEGVTGYPALTLGDATFTAPTEGSALELGALSLTGGTATFSGTRMKWSSTAPAVASALGATPVARLVLDGATVCERGSSFAVGATADTCGIVEIRPDALVSNDMRIGTASGACGALYQTGGSLVSSRDVIWGANGGEGYCELSGGTQDSPWVHSVGRLGGTGLFYQKGGLLKKSSNPLCVGYSGTGVVYQTAGLIDHGNARLQLGEMRWLVSDAQRSMPSFVNYTVSGVATSTVWEIDGARHPNIDVYVNLNDGGTLFTDVIRKNSTFPDTSVTSPAIENNHLYLNFNGGTLRNRHSSKTGLIPAAQAPDRITVYPKGATFEIGYATFTDIALGVPLLAPGEGMGVTSVVWTAQDGYVAPPLVTIEGDGQGATAVAEFDSSSGTVTSITITSPGWGYTAATAILSGGGKAAGATAACALGDVSGGGVTKRGTGKLTLSAVNTYTGATAVEEGILVQGVAGAIPSGTRLVLQQGATLDLNNIETTFSGVEGTGGKVTNGNLALSGVISLSAQKFIDRETTAIDGVLDLTGVTELSLTNADVLTEATQAMKSLALVSATSIRQPTAPLVVSGVPSGWTLDVTTTAIRLRYSRGLIMIVR